jgi:hypothetical protein
MFASPPFTFYIQRKGGEGQGGWEVFLKKVFQYRQKTLNKFVCMEDTLRLVVESKISAANLVKGNSNKRSA